ncbi:MAG: hypothetical protein EOO07_01865 [Chitinophagaceae bacterium]|nr:MAG: hypothetical protein EOO07_01865 [Chitinophagaceae bacterium]
MKTLITIVISLIVLFCTSCKNSINPQSSVDITVLNQQGENLLVPPAGYSKENIDLSYIVNGEAKLYTSLFSHGSKGFFLIPDLNLHKIRIDLNHDRKEKYPLTLVKFGNTKVDTIKAKFNYIRQSTPIIQAVWLNGVEKDIKGFIIVK